MAERPLPGWPAGVPEWQAISSAPRETRLLGFVDGDVRFVMWTKTSHVPLYGWCLVDQGEECDFCEPSHWLPLPPAPCGSSPRQTDNGEQP